MGYGFNFTARQMARAVCQAFMLHDDKDYEGSAQKFADVYQSLFDIQRDKAMRMGRLFVKALEIHDHIEDVFNGTDGEVYNHDRWQEVEKCLLDICKEAGISDRWAKEYTMFLKHHTAYVHKEDSFIKHLISAEAAMIEDITKNRKWAEALSPIYVCCVRGHDMHTDKAWKFNEDLMAVYYEKILEAKNNV